jgi:hypothetical protein
MLELVADSQLQLHAVDKASAAVTLVDENRAPWFGRG